MADVELNQFLPGIRSFVPGCPDSLMKQAVLDACIRLCIDSWIIREDLYPGDIEAGVDDYLIIPSQYRRSVSLISILYDGRELVKKTEEELDVLDPGWRTGITGVPTYVTMTQPDRIRLNRLPETTITGGFIPRIVTRPSEDADVVEEQLYTNWKKAIEYGALSFLLEIQGKKWTDLKQSDYFGKKFLFNIQRAKDRATMGYFKKSTTARRRAWV